MNSQGYQKKHIQFILFLIFLLVIFVCVVMNYKKNQTISEKDEREVLSEEVNKDSAVTIGSDTSFEEMKEVYASIDKGFNIGNSLDACDWSYFGDVYKTGYQAAVVYNTNSWSAWDESEYVYFNEEGKAVLTWDLSSLKAGKNSYASGFSIQMVNHDPSYEGTTVKCKVVNVSMLDSNGDMLDVPNDCIKAYDLSVVNGICSFCMLDLSSYDMRTSDLYSTTLKVSLEISDYYLNTAEHNALLEMSWGNPQISEEFIKILKADGFNTIRIPVTYFNHISEDGTIDPLFLDRVEQVVDWVLENDMYCITDVHHDTGNQGWIRASEANYNTNSDIVYGIFVQIAERMKNKSNKLILEGLNEAVNDKSKWNRIPSKDLAAMNKWNQLFVDAVRSTGGNNSNRYLLINTYAALSLNECLMKFKMPSDEAKNKIFVGIHCYYDEGSMKSGFKTIEKYAEKYPLVISEWGFGAGVSERYTLVKNFIENAYEAGVPQIVWDDGGESGMGLYNRITMEKFYPEIVSAIVGK